MHLYTDIAAFLISWVIFSLGGRFLVNYTGSFVSVLCGMHSRLPERKEASASGSALSGFGGDMVVVGMKFVLVARWKFWHPSGN